MKTKHMGIVAIVLILSSVILILHLSGQSCYSPLAYNLVVILAFQVITIAVVFGIFLKMTAKQRALLNNKDKITQEKGSGKPKGHGKD